MNKKAIYTFSFLVFSFLVSCKNSEKKDTVTPVHIADLHVTVMRNDSTAILKPLNAVTVYLFLTDNDRTQNQNTKFSGTVNDSGKISFNNLPDDYYFILASHAAYGIKKSETATPNNSVSYEEINY